METERVLSNDWVVRHENRLYQVERQSRNHAPAKSTVTVCEWEDGTMEIHYRGKKLAWHGIDGRPQRVVLATSKPVHKVQPATPAPEHPWRKDYRSMKVWPTGAADRLPLASASAAP